MASPFCAERFYRDLIVLALGMGLSLACTAAVASKEIVLQACEADDARYALNHFGEPHWHSGWQRFGQWRFANDARMACSREACVVSTAFYLTLDQASKPAQLRHEHLLPSPFPSHERDGTEQTIIKNGEAADLRRAIKKKSYELSTNEIGLAWVNYGRIARYVRLRSRTEIRCKVNALWCSVENNIIAFISYDIPRLPN